MMAGDKEGSNNEGIRQFLANGYWPTLSRSRCAMVGLSQLFLDARDWLAALEVNPLIALTERSGVRAVAVRTQRR